MTPQICTGQNKPNGTFFLEPDRAKIVEFMRTLPIRKVSGIGKVTEKVLNAFGITLCGELYEKRSLLYQVFSEHSALWFISVALGIGSTSTQKKKRQRKSISTERTFSNLERKEEILELLGRFSEKLAAQLKEKNLQAKTLSVKLKEVNFAVSSKSVTLTNPLRCISSAEDIYKNAVELISASLAKGVKLRLIGIRLSGLQSTEEPLIMKLLKAQPVSTQSTEITAIQQPTPTPTKKTKTIDSYFKKIN